MAVISNLDYQEHATEYGIHWNFFTTITCIHFMLLFIRRCEVAFPLAFTLMIGYELVLAEYSLDQYIFHAPRVDFISANREGITSLIGYFSL
jgi:glucosaminylphosphatidylinositol acyltransferase